MDINALKAFIQVSESGSFSRAASELHLTQPAVSKRIALLENQLEQRLIDRIGRKISLTQAGRTLLPRAKQILSQIEDTKRSLSNLAGDVSGTLNLGISHHLGLHRLPPVIKRFSQNFPLVTLDVHFLDSEIAYEGVLHGDIELAVTTLAQNASDHKSARVQAIQVWNDPLKFVVSRDHPLAQQANIELSSLTQFKAILPQPETFTGTLIRQLFEDQGLSLNASNSTNYLETIKMMVSIGLGWSLLPESLLDQQLVELAIPGVKAERQLGAIYHTQRTLSNSASAFLAELGKEKAGN